MRYICLTLSNPPPPPVHEFRSAPLIVGSGCCDYFSDITFSHKPIRVNCSDLHPFQSPSAILGPPGGYFGFWWWHNFAGGEWVLPLPALLGHKFFSQRFFCIQTSAKQILPSSVKLNHSWIFIKIFLGPRFLGSSENLDSDVVFIEQEGYRRMNKYKKFICL